jgi:signal transduction histidine kinase
LTEEFGRRDNRAKTLKALAEQAQTKGLESALRIAPGASGRLIADPACLRQILVNLLGKAKKFTKRGEVRSRWTKSSPGRPRSMTRLLS